VQLKAFRTGDYLGGPEDTDSTLAAPSGGTVVGTGAAALMARACDATAAALARLGSDGCDEEQPRASGGAWEYGEGSGSGNGSGGCGGGGSGSGRTPYGQEGCDGIGKSLGPAISGVAIEAFGSLLFGRYVPGSLQATAGAALLAAAVARLHALHHQTLRQGDASRRGSGARSGDSAGGSLWEQTWDGLLEMLGLPDAAPPSGPALPSESHAPKMPRRVLVPRVTPDAVSFPARVFATLALVDAFRCATETNATATSCDCRSALGRRLTARAAALRRALQQSERQGHARAPRGGLGVRAGDGAGGVGVAGAPYLAAAAADALVPAIHSPPILWACEVEGCWLLAAEWAAQCQSSTSEAERPSSLSSTSSVSASSSSSSLSSSSSSSSWNIAAGAGNQADTFAWCSRPVPPLPPCLRETAFLQEQLDGTTRGNQSMAVLFVAVKPLLLVGSTHRSEAH